MGLRILCWLALSCLVAAVEAESLEEITVTATRRGIAALQVPTNLARLDAEQIDLAGADHAAQLLNRLPGVNMQRGSGQESLLAIRSPVLTGSGSCGAFLILEDGLPIRPTGLCNVNGLFEVNTEQAAAIELIRGPGPALYGANAIHGTVNVLSPAASEVPATFGVEYGVDAFRRLAASGHGELHGAQFAAYGNWLDDPGFRQDAGFKQWKANLLSDRALARGRLRMRIASTDLAQQTAGFIIGQDAYRDLRIRLTNANPEAYRNARSLRMGAQWSREVCDRCSDDLRLVLRDSSMDFLQHFLPGQPREANAQRSMTVALLRSRPAGARLDWQLGLDVGAGRSELLEIQDNPVTTGTPAARAIRPVGRHYDYGTRNLMAAAHAGGAFNFATRWQAQAGLRAEWSEYNYDNRMLDGNTDEAGNPCPFGGCLFNRPADRSDHFVQWIPQFSLSFRPDASSHWYLAWANGFRPPESGELYRLQRGQQVADLRAETASSVELGFKRSHGPFEIQLAAYDMRKDNVILRDADGFNLSDGATRHRGAEYDLKYRLNSRWLLSASGSRSHHWYARSVGVDGGEAIIAGNQVDTAPRDLHDMTLTYVPGPAMTVQVEAQYVGRYFVDASDSHEYPGHTVVNANIQWRWRSNWQARLRLENLTDRLYADRADYAFGNYRYFPARRFSAFLQVRYGR
ncbi:MAG: TonB-dependent receptor [Steroidobacteraceae bacterium]